MKLQIVLNEREKAGATKNKKETVINMLKENLPYDVIKRCTGVSDEEFTKIVKSVQN